MTVGCGSDGGAGGAGTTYDGRYDCSQTVACLEQSKSAAPPGTVDQCVSESFDSYAKLSPAGRASLDSQFRSCRSLTACEYVKCVGSCQVTSEISDFRTEYAVTLRSLIGDPVMRTGTCSETTQRPEKQHARHRVDARQRHQQRRVQR